MIISKYFLFFTALFVILPFILDTFFYNLRIKGLKDGNSGYGYSLHLRYSSLARFFLIFGGPMIGYVNDTVNDERIILQLGLLSSIIILCVFTFNAFLTGKFILFSKIKINYYFLLSTSLYGIIVIGNMFVFNYLSLLYPSYKATILQSTPIFNGFATILHVLYIDKLISKKIILKELSEKIIALFFGRYIASIILILMFSIILY